MSGALGPGAGCGCAVGARMGPPARRAVQGGAGSQVRRLLIPRGSAQPGFLAGICSAQALADSGSMDTAAAARSHCPGGGPGATRATGTVGAQPRAGHGEAGAYPGAERAPGHPWAAVGSACGDMGTALQHGHSCRGLSRLRCSRAPRGAGVRRHPPPPLAAPQAPRGPAVQPPEGRPHTGTAVPLPTAPRSARPCHCVCLQRCCPQRVPGTPGDGSQQRQSRLGKDIPAAGRGPAVKFRLELPFVLSSLPLPPVSNLASAGSKPGPGAA